MRAKQGGTIKSLTYDGMLSDKYGQKAAGCQVKCRLSGLCELGQYAFIVAAFILAALLLLAALDAIGVEVAFVLGFNGGLLCGDEVPDPLVHFGADEHFAFTRTGAEA